METKGKTLRIDPELWNRFKALAALKGCKNLSEMLEILIGHYEEEK